MSHTNTVLFAAQYVQWKFKYDAHCTLSWNELIWLPDAIAESGSVRLTSLQRCTWLGFYIRCVSILEMHLHRPGQHLPTERNRPPKSCRNLSCKRNSKNASKRSALEQQVNKYFQRVFIPKKKKKFTHFWLSWSMSSLTFGWFTRFIYGRLKDCAIRWICCVCYFSSRKTLSMSDFPMWASLGPGRESNAFLQCIYLWWTYLRWAH